MIRETTSRAQFANWRRRLLLSSDLAPCLGGLFRGLADLLVKIGEFLALFDQLFQEWRRLPQRAMLFFELGDAVIDFLQPHRVGIPHRTAAIGRETVAVQINDVDVHGPQRKTLL